MRSCPEYFVNANHRSMGLRARALFAKLASHGLRGPCYGISFGHGRFELQGKSLGRPNVLCENHKGDAAASPFGYAN